MVGLAIMLDAIGTRTVRNGTAGARGNILFHFFGKALKLMVILTLNKGELFL
jgi:hypothetical protein